MMASMRSLCRIFESDLFPYSNPAVGRPLPVVSNPTPSAEEVLDLHRQYCDALTDLFEQHKAAAGLPKDAHLEIM